MGARLFISSVDGRTVEEELAYPFDQFRVIIGRTAAADIRLPHRTVSERHASLEQGTGAYRLTDNGSTNGTRINGTRLVPHRARRLQDGDRIDIGIYQLSFHDGILVTEPLTSERTAELARRLLREQARSPHAGRADPPRIVVVSGPQSGHSIDLPDPPVRLTIGSGSACGLVLHDQAVEPDHMTLCWGPEGVKAEITGSEDAFFSVGGHALSACPLKDGDELLVGSTSLLFEEPAEAALGALDSDYDQPHAYDAPRPRAVARPREKRPDVPPSAVQGGTAAGEAGPSGAVAHPQDSDPADAPEPGPSLTADLLVFGLAGVMLTLSVAALLVLLRS